MRFLFFCVLSILFQSVSVKGQSVKLEVGVSYKQDDFYIQSSLGVYKDHFLVLAWDGRKNDKGEKSSSFKFVYINKNTLKIDKEIKRPSFEIVEYKEYEKSTFLHSSLLNKDTIELVYRTEVQIKKDIEVKYLYSVWKLDAETCLPFSDNPQTMHKHTYTKELEEEKENEAKVNWLSFSNEINNNRYVSKSYLFDEKEKTVTIEIQVYNRKFENTYESEITLRNILEPDMLDYVYIDKFNNISIVYYSGEYISTPTTEELWANIDYYEKNSNKPVTTKLHIPNGQITRSILIQPDTTGNGKCRVLGMFSTMGTAKADFKLFESSTDIKNFNGGSFVFSVDMAAGEVEKFEQFLLTDNQGKNLWPKNSAGLGVDLDDAYYNQFRTHSIVKVINDEQKNTYFVVQSSYAEQSESTRKYNNNSLVVFKVLADNTIAWNVVIPRLSSQMTFKKAMDPYVYFLNDELHVLFNDREENIGPIQSMQAGEKLKIKTIADIKNLPPTSSDSPVLLETWIKNEAVLRHTIVYPDGKWTAKWGQLVDPHGGDSPPALDASDFYFEKGSNIGFGSAFTNYGKTGKWAFSKITIQ
jgi:hypothetical protein